MTEQRRNTYNSIKDFILIGLQCILIPVLFSFDNRIRDLEQTKQGQIEQIKNLNDKADHMIRLQEETRAETLKFFKEYSGALDYTKRQMEKSQ